MRVRWKALPVLRLRSRFRRLGLPSFPRSLASLWSSYICPEPIFSRLRLMTWLCFKFYSCSSCPDYPCLLRSFRIDTRPCCCLLDLYDAPPQMLPSSWWISQLQAESSSFLLYSSSSSLLLHFFFFFTSSSLLLPHFFFLFVSPFPSDCQMSGARWLVDRLGPSVVYFSLSLLYSGVCMRRDAKLRSGGKKTRAHFLRLLINEKKDA